MIREALNNYSDQQGEDFLESERKGEEKNERRAKKAAHPTEAETIKVRKKYTQWDMRKQQYNSLGVGAVGVGMCMSMHVCIQMHVS